MSGSNIVKDFYGNGNLWRHYYAVDGEYRSYYNDGRSKEVIFYKHEYTMITNEVEEVVDDILNITNEEKLFIKLKFGVDCL